MNLSKQLKDCGDQGKRKTVKSVWSCLFLEGRIWQIVSFHSEKGLKVLGGWKGENPYPGSSIWDLPTETLTEDEKAQLVDEQKAFQETIYQGIANKLGETLHVGYPFGKEENIQAYEPNN